MSLIRIVFPYFDEPVTKLETTGQNESLQDQINFMWTSPATSPGTKLLTSSFITRVIYPTLTKKSVSGSINTQNSSSQSGSQSQAMGYTGNNSTAILEDNGKENVVLSTGGGNNLAGGTQTVVRKPASQKDLQTEKTTSSQPTAASTAVLRVQSGIQVAEKNTSNIRVPPSKDNQAGKGNLTFYQADRQEIKPAMKFAPSSISEASSSTRVSLPSGKTPSVQASVVPETAPSPDTNMAASADVNANVNSTGKISVKKVYPQVGQSNELDLSSKIDQSKVNQPPVLKDLVPDRTSPQLPGVRISWKAEAADEEGDKILYKFLLDGKEVRKWSKANSWSWPSQGLPAGDYEITVLVIDCKHASGNSFDDGLSATFTLSSHKQAPVLQKLKSDKAGPQAKDAAITTTVVDSNQPPVLKTLVPDIASPKVQCATVIWKAEAQDPEGDKILYKFQLNDRDMSRWSESANWKWSSKNLATGDYKIRVLARDGKHAPEDSFDSSMDSHFTLISEIDQQIDQLMKKRATEASQKENYQSPDIQVTSINGSKSNTILGKNSGTARQEKTVTPRKLGG